MHCKPVFAAPLQGYTTAIWRHFHSQVFGNVSRYFSPFLRIENGQIRKRDLNDISSHLSDRQKITPQAIFKDSDELKAIIATIAQAGYKTADLNLGCPFPPQVKKGRGAGLLARPDILEQTALVIKQFPQISFSVKMRTGITDNRQWENILPIINDIPLDHVTIHPRTAAMQYGGVPDIETAAEMAQKIKHPTVYNGDINTPVQYRQIIEKIPSIAAVMIGRGLLSQPWLAAEIATGTEYTQSIRLEKLRLFHSLIFAQTEKQYINPANILDKIKPFWDYITPQTVDRKKLKAIKKAATLEKYLQIIQTI